MSAERLREAADRLGALAEAHEGRDWDWTGVGAHGYPQRVSSIGDAALIAETYNNPDMPHPAAEYIAAMHPGVGKALAAWLRTAGADLWAHGPLHCAEGCVECDDDLWMPHVRRAIAVADAILGRAA